MIPLSYFSDAMWMEQKTYPGKPCPKFLAHESMRYNRIIAFFLKEKATEFWSDLFYIIDNLNNHPSAFLLAQIWEFQVMVK
jgi:hypothetical protein